MEANSKTLVLSLKKWISFSTLGWLLGVILVVLMALFLELIHLGYSSQVVVGLGMSTGVGLMQWLILKRYWDLNLTWIMVSIGGFGFSYLLADGVIYFFSIKPEIILPFATGMSALIGGWLQNRLVLNKLVKPSFHWISHNFIAWILAHLVTMGLFYLSSKLNAGLPSYLSLILAFLFLIVGGPILGFITSKVILPLVNGTNSNLQ